MKSPSSRWTPRYGLASLLVVVLFVAVLLAWFADHRRQMESVQRVAAELAISQRQVEQLQAQLKQRAGAMTVVHYWESADVFVQALMDIEDEKKFSAMAATLSQADEQILDDAIAKLCRLTSHGDNRTRQRSTMALSHLRQVAIERTEKNSPVLIRSLLSRLEDPACFPDACVGLASFGPAAGEALSVLRKTMADDANPNAALAAHAVALIDPQTDIGPRLIEIIDRRHPSWPDAAGLLADHVAPASARQVLTALYERLDQVHEREFVVNALNKLESPPPGVDAAP